jgi:hypothetical protein
MYTASGTYTVRGFTEYVIELRCDFPYSMYPLRVNAGVIEWSRWSNWVLPFGFVAGATSVGMALAGVHSPARAVLVLAFLAVVPTVAIAGLLRSFDLFARIVVACAANITILTLTATIMLAEGVWSPVAGLLGVTVATLLCLVAQWPPVSRRGGRPSMRAPAAPDPSTSRKKSDREQRRLRVPPPAGETRRWRVEPIALHATGEDG